MGVLLAFALMLSYIESILSFQTGIPGIKLGLANLAVVLCLYLFDWKAAVILTIVKAVLSGFLFGNLFMISYSLAGAIVSCLLMILLKKSKRFHVPIVSAAGGVMHNLGQLAVAYFTIQTYGVFYYAPFLLIAGLITGGVIGMVSALVLPYLTRIVLKGEQP